LGFWRSNYLDSGLNEKLLNLKEENSILESVLSFIKDHKVVEGSTFQEDYDEARGYLLGIEEERVII